MRSSSIKTLVAAVTLTFTVIAAAPIAQARPSRPQRPSKSAPSMANRAQIVVNLLLKRVFGISANELPSDPIPSLFAPGIGTQEQYTELPSDPIPSTKP